MAVLLTELPIDLSVHLDLKLIGYQAAESLVDGIPV